jgi:hypothetical protein
MYCNAWVRSPASVAFGSLQVLDQTTTMLDVKNLKTAADSQNGHIASQSVRNHCQFHSVAWNVEALVGFGRRLFAVEFGADVCATRKNQPVHTIQVPIRSYFFQKWF